MADDTQGAFSIPDVTPPYELLVRMETARGAKPYVRLYKELTLQEPNVFNIDGDSFEKRSNTLTGKVTGVQSTSESARVSVIHELPRRHALWAQSPFGGGDWADASGAFTFKSNWSMDPAEAGSLYAIQYTLENDRPKGYLAYGRRDQVSFQTAPPALDIAMSPVTSSSLSVEVEGMATSSHHNIQRNLEPPPPWSRTWTPWRGPPRRRRPSRCP